MSLSVDNLILGPLVTVVVGEYYAPWLGLRSHAGLAPSLLSLGLDVNLLTLTVWLLTSTDFSSPSNSRFSSCFYFRACMLL